MKITILALTALASLAAADLTAQSAFQASFHQARTSSVRSGGFGFSLGSSFSSSNTSINAFGSTGGAQLVTAQPTIVAQPIIVQAQPVVIQRPVFVQAQPVVIRPFFGQQVVVAQPVVIAQPIVTRPIVGQQVLARPFGVGTNNGLPRTKTITKSKTRKNGAQVVKTKVQPVKPGKRKLAGRKKRR